METEVIDGVHAVLMRAKMYEWFGDWSNAERFATIAVEGAPALVPAYLVRALARRVQGNLEGAICDYEKAIELDPQCELAWEFRGACRSTLAARLPREKARALQARAEQDFRQAVLLDPTNEQAALSMVEAAICAERYREAFGHAGECWRTVSGLSQRVICAWLGCIAGLLARRPPQTWQQYTEILRRRETTLSQTAWCTAEINGVIARLFESKAYDADTLAEIEAVHNLFLGHFEQGGPVLH